MNSKTRTIRQLVAAFAVALVLLGLGSQLTSAKIYTSHGNTVTKSQFKGACGTSGGSYMRVHRATRESAPTAMATRTAATSEPTFAPTASP